MSKILFVIFFIISTVSKCQDTVLIQFPIDTISIREISIYSVRPSKSSPVTQTTLLKDNLLKSYHGQDIPIIIQNTPSIITYSDGGNYNGYMYYKIRGIDQTRIQSTLDGVPLNEPEDQGAYFSNYQDFTSNIESVQVQRGIGTTSSGLSSFGGSLNFEGPKIFSRKKSIEVGGGSFNTKRMSILIGDTIGKSMGVYFRLSDISSDGYRDNSGTHGSTAFLSVGKLTKKTFTKLTSFIGRSVNQMSYLPSSYYEIINNRRHNPLSPSEDDNFIQNLTYLQHTKYVDPWWKYQITGFYNYLNGNYDVIFPPDSLNFKLKSNFFGLNTNCSYERENNYFIFGINLNGYTRRHSMSLIDSRDLIYQNLGLKEEISGFFKYERIKTSFMPYFDVQIRSVRFRYRGDIESGAYWTFFNPRIGARYKLKNFSLYGFVGISTREPTRNDILGGNDNLDMVNHRQEIFRDLFPFTRVRPETVLDKEIGADINKNNLLIKINFFHMKFTNEIIPIGQLSYIGLPLRKNVDFSSRYGFEVESSLDYEKWKFTLNGCLMSSRIRQYFDELDNRLYTNVVPITTPNVISNANIEKKINKFNLSISSRYVSKSYLTNSNNPRYQLPSYIVFNSNISYKLLDLSIIISCNNILNRKYYNHGYVSNENLEYFVAPTRNFFISLRKEF